ncbi:MAG: hypothetical protein M3Y30_01075 [Gemmatimonadota bacterium]|nr:hypothetical protein [Gemmatimonadota bacterium]
MLFSNRPPARRPPSQALSLLAERPLQHSTHRRYTGRLAVFAIALAVGAALACYQDKPPATKAAEQTTVATPAGGSAKLDLQPVPATHDTAIREIDEFRLTQQGFQQWEQAKHAIDSLHATNPEVEARMKAETAPKTVDEAGKRFDEEPQMRAALKQSGLSGKDFLLTSIALQQAMKGYQLKTLGKLDQSKVPPAIMENINFVGSHMTQIMGSMTGVVPRHPMP